MHRPRAWLSWLLAFPLVSLALAGPTRDQVKLENAGKAVKGILVDGLLDGQSVNDRVYTSVEAGHFFNALFPTVILDNMGASTVSNEVIGFTSGRPPELHENVAWTDASNTVRLKLEEPYAIRVVAWIVFGPFDQQSLVAIDGSLATTKVWEGERQGILFDSFEILDATADPEATHFSTFTCSLKAAIQNEIGFEPGAINVYYVEKVDFGVGPSSHSGVWCGGGVIGMGWQTSPVLLTHELGHGLGLQHIDGSPEWFDKTNVMHPASSSRRYLTEGQTFRSVFEPLSAINSIYGLRPGETTRDCETTTATTDPQCPPIQKRIWSDGSWAPN